jgi:two-component system sensor histidine kinase CpxA
VRSISAKILLWTLATFVGSLAAFAFLSARLALQEPGPGDFLVRTIAMIEEDAVRAYEHGGASGLGDHIRRLDAYYRARHYMLDVDGKDLVSGVDRSSLIQGRRPGDRHPVRRKGGGLTIVHELAQGRYLFVIVPEPLFNPNELLPFFAAVVLVIGLLGYALATHLASPLRELREVVARFGRGDLSARASTTRRDEIGQLSRAFNEMATQIATLRAAELRLLQDVSHELRSPLARLGFNLELARLEEDREVAFERIRRDLDRLSSLVGELLQLTCAEGDPGSRVLENVELNGLLEALVEDCTPEASARGCCVCYEAETAATVVGDRELLRRAVENVLRNAIRHAPEGTVVEVELRGDSGWASVSVRDRGAGVPENSLGAIFEPFFRVGDDRSRSSGGVGLGLSIARRAVELHQGRITARNAEPGLLVTIEVPLGSEPDGLEARSRLTGRMA